MARVTSAPSAAYDDVAMPGIGYNDDRAALGLAVGLASADRRRSFSNFPTSSRIAKEKLVAAHFTYTGPGDCAMCEHCGGKLHKWSASDSPLAQHAKHFPHCPYVQTYLREMGLSYRATEMSGLDPENPDGESQLSYLLGRRGLRDAKQTEHFKRGRNPLSASKLPGAKPLSEAAGTPNTARPQNPDIGIGPCLTRVNFRTDNRDVKSRMDLPIVRTMISELGFKPEVIRSVIREKLSTTGDDFETAECLALAVMEHEKARAAVPYTVPPLPQRKPAARSGTGTASSPDVVAATWDDVTKARDRKRCKICRQREATILLLPCSHMVLCKQCLPGEDRCPVKTCDREISHFVEAFIS